MTNVSSVLFLAVVFLLAIGTRDSIGSSGGEHSQKLTSQASGTLTVTSIDLDGDFIPGFISSYKGSLSPFGPFSAQGFIESSPTTNKCTTPNGEAGTESTLVAGSDVLRIDSTGDLIFSTTTIFTACFGIDSSFSFSFTDTITGGTGKFANATGSINVTGTGVIVDPFGTISGFTSTGTGTITTK
jgi:hypothetical protein